jgi:hypothetical protein
MMPSAAAAGARRSRSDRQTDRQMMHALLHPRAHTLAGLVSGLNDCPPDCLAAQFDFCAKTYLLPLERGLFERDFREGELYIVKPPAQVRAPRSTRAARRVRGVAFEGRRR